MASFMSKRLKMYFGNVPLNHSHTENIITVRVSVREINGIICLDACNCRAAAGYCSTRVIIRPVPLQSPYRDRCHCIRIHSELAINLIIELSQQRNGDI